jgi:hypothetical protein
MELDLPSDDDGPGLDTMEPVSGQKGKRQAKWTTKKDTQPQKRKKCNPRFEGRSIDEVMKTVVIPHRASDLWFVEVPRELQGVPQDDFMEIYSPPRLVPLAVQAGMRASASLDLLTGWNFLTADGRALAVQEVKTRRPKVLMLSPPCTMFSGLMNLNWFKLPVDRREQSLINGTTHLEFSMLLADLQHSSGRGFCFEHPQTARSWKNERVDKMKGQVQMATFDQCMFGLRSKVDAILMKKTTRLLTNIPQLHAAFDGRRCDKSHHHVSIQGTEGGEKRSVWAQRYPAPMCEVLIATCKAFASSR